MPRIILFFVLALSFFAVQTALGQDSETAKNIPLGVLNEKAEELTMPVFPNMPEITGNVVIQIKIDLQRGEVVSARAVAGHPLLRLGAETAAKKAKFAPVLKDFRTIYGIGVLIYKIEDFNGRVIKNKNPKRLLTVLEFRSSMINGNALKLEKPEYSNEARDDCAAGKVEVLTLVYSASGEVFAAQAISGDELLFDASEIAVLLSKFAPSRITGDNNFYVLSKVVYNFDSLAKCVVGKAIYLAKPRVPSQFGGKLRKVEKVLVEAQIDEKGIVLSAKAVSGHPILRAVSVQAARFSKFSGTKINGDLAKSKALITYTFKIAKSREGTPFVNYIKPL